MTEGGELRAMLEAGELLNIVSAMAPLLVALARAELLWGVGKVPMIDPEERGPIVATAVAAHEQISAPADETWRPFATPQACRTQPMAALLMSVCFDGSH